MRYIPVRGAGEIRARAAPATCRRRQSARQEQVPILAARSPPRRRPREMVLRRRKRHAGSLCWIGSPWIEDAGAHSVKARQSGGGFVFEGRSSDRARKLREGAGLGYCWQERAKTTQKTPMRWLSSSGRGGCARRTPMRISDSCFTGGQAAAGLRLQRARSQSGKRVSPASRSPPSIKSPPSELLAGWRL